MSRSADNEHPNYSVGKSFGVSSSDDDCLTSYFVDSMRSTSSGDHRSSPEAGSPSCEQNGKKNLPPLKGSVRPENERESEEGGLEKANWNQKQEGNEPLRGDSKTWRTLSATFSPSPPKPPPTIRVQEQRDNKEGSQKQKVMFQEDARTNDLEEAGHKFLTEIELLRIERFERLMNKYFSRVRRGNLKRFEKQHLLHRIMKSVLNEMEDDCTRQTVRVYCGPLEHEGSQLKENQESEMK